MRIDSEIVVVGTGAGGATVARELAKRGQEVLVLERGSTSKGVGSLKSAVFQFYDKCALRTSSEGTIIYRALMPGGTTVVSCGNGVRVLESELRDLGIILDEEFNEVERELAINPLDERLIGAASRNIMDAANRLNMDMYLTPKFIESSKCTSCGRCVLGCKTGAKWSALSFLGKARRNGAKLLTGVNVKAVVSRGSKTIGIVASHQGEILRIRAKKVILAAGGIGTPAILKRSGIDNAGEKLFADLFNVTYGITHNENINQWQEPTMAVISTKYLDTKGFLLSSYVDVPLVLRWVMSKRKQIKNIRMQSLIGIMAKSKDDSTGKVTAEEKFLKFPSKEDMERLDEGALMSKNILVEAGVKEPDVIFTKPRGAHPGGSAAIGEVVDTNLETKIKGLYVCDASVLPRSCGAPPILTILSLAKRLSKHVLK